MLLQSSPGNPPHPSPAPAPSSCFPWLHSRGARRRLPGPIGTCSQGSRAVWHAAASISHPAWRMTPGSHAWSELTERTGRTTEDASADSVVDHGESADPLGAVGARSPHRPLRALWARHRFVPERGHLPGAAGMSIVSPARPARHAAPRSPSGTTSPCCPGYCCGGAAGTATSRSRPAIRWSSCHVRRCSPVLRLGSATTGRSRRSWSCSPGSWRSRSSTSRHAVAEEDRLAAVSARDGAVGRGGGGHGALARLARGGHLRGGLVRRVLPAQSRQSPDARLWRRPPRPGAGPRARLVGRALRPPGFLRGQPDRSGHRGRRSLRPNA